MKHQYGNESVIKTTKEEEALIKRLITLNLKHHVMQYMIDIVTLCWKNDRIGKRIYINPSKDKW